MKKFFLGMVMVLALLSGTAAVPAYAAPIDASRDQVCRGVNGTGGSCASGGAELTRVIKAALNVLSVIAGVAGVIMIIVAGLKYITSSGDAQAVSGAKRTIIYAIVGLIVVALSQFIVKYVLHSAR